MRALLFISLCVLGACAASQPGAREARFCRVETAHFSVYTDLPKERAREQALDLERIFSALRQYGWSGGSGQLPMRLNVVMFKSDLDFRVFGGQKYNGYMTTALFEPWIVLPSPSHLRGPTTLIHELTHYLAFLALQQQPPWFAEGIATYFETASLDETGALVLGSVPRAHAEVLQYSGMMPLQELLAEDADKLDERFYPSAWLLVHYLMSEQGDGFARYQQALAAGQSSGKAWQHAFASLPMEQLKTQVAAYLQRSRFDHFSVRVRSQPAKATAFELTFADERALDAILWQSAIGREKKERKAHALHAARHALSLDPAQPQALAMVLNEEPVLSARIARARASAQAQPDSWLAWATLSRALAEAGELRRDSQPDPVAHLMRLSPRHPYSWLAASIQHASSNEYDHALRCARRARKLAPTDASLLESQARLLSALHACDELKLVLQTLNNLDAVPEAGFEADLLTRCSLTPGSTPS